MVLARLLAPEAFGIIATLNIVIALAETFSSAGFQKYVVQHKFNDEDHFNRGASVAFWTNLFVSVITWAVIASFNPQLAKIVGSEGYGIPLMIASLALPLASLSSVHEGIFQRKLEYRVLFVRRLIVSLVPLFVTIPLALFGFGYWSLIIGTLSGNLFKFLLFLFMSKWKPKLYYSFRLFREMFSFCSWTLLESIAMWACSYIDVLIISNRLGDYYTGLYKNSQSMVTGILAIITGATTSVLFSSLSRAQDDQKRFNQIFFSFQKYVAIFVLPLGVGIFCFRDLITLILLGKQWTEASFFVGIWGLCTSLVCVFGTFCREVYRAKGKPKISLIAQLLHLAFIIPVCIIFVDKGFDSLALARSLAYLQIIIVHMFLMGFVFKISPLKMFYEVKEPILCSLIMGVFGLTMVHFFSHKVYLQITYVLVCVLIYFGSILLFPQYRKLLLVSLSNIKARFSKNKANKNNDDINISGADQLQEKCKNTKDEI